MLSIKSCFISSRIAGSSIVGGILYSTLSAIFLIVPLRIFPDLVFGSLLITIAILNAAPEKINREIFNVGYKNQSVNELAKDVQSVIGEDIKIVNTKSDDNRSYHVSSQKIKDILNFETQFTVQDAVLDLKSAFEQKLLINTFNNEFFYNIKRMNSIQLQ